MKRKYALAAALVGALVLPLCGCGNSAGAIERKAYEYLSSRYSAEFTIASAEREIDGPGPIPSFRSSFHWVLTATSNQFPNDTFTIRYLHDDNNNWNWLYDYFSLLLRDQTISYFSEMIQPYLDTPDVVRILWGTTAWPDETGEGTSIHEWFQAGGEISQIQVFLDDVIPNDNLCKAPAINILQTAPNVHYITFFRLSHNGFTDVIHGSNPIDIYQEESSKDWSQIWRIDYGQWDLEESSARYFKRGHSYG